MSHAVPAGRRTLLGTVGGLAGILALGRAPAIAQTKPTKLILCTNGPPPELAGASSQWFSQQVTARSGGALAIDFQGGTLITKEIEIVNAVRSGNVAIGSPIGAMATVFPETGVFLVPYLVPSYDEAYAMFNGAVGDQLDRTFQKKYGVKVLYFFDLGFRHFWNSRRPITTPRDLRGLKFRTQPSKVFADTINGLGGVAVPLPWTEVITAAQQGVIDGADLPVANMVPLRAYEVSKYYSLTYHNYGPTVMVINLGVWNGLPPEQQKLMLDVGRETQDYVRKAMEGVDGLDAAKKLLEPLGMVVNAADVDAFRQLARTKVWPAYKPQYPELWDRIAKA